MENKYMIRLLGRYWFFVRLLFLLFAIIGVVHFWPDAKRLDNERVMHGDFSVRDGKLGSLLYFNGDFLGCWVGDFSDAGCPAVALKYINPKADPSSPSKVDMGSCKAVVDDYLSVLTRKKFTIIVHLECDKYSLPNFTKDALEQYRGVRGDRFFTDGRYLAYFIFMILFRADLVALFRFLKKRG